MSGEQFIMQMKPWFGEEEKKALADYMDEGGFLTEFKKTEQFEKDIAAYVGAKHCIVVNNGTISLSLAALACGLKAGDEVIVPNYTMIATPNAVKMFGMQPVFVDVEPDTLVMDIDLARAAVTNKTRAIMLVSANGRYPKAGIAAFEALAKEYGLRFIEDAAQSLGSFYPDGRHMGMAGDVGSFSFSAPKIISTGQGGCLVTNNKDLATKIRKLKDFGRAAGGNDYHDSLGLNFKFTDLQACVGIEQMKKLPFRVDRKKAIYQRYKSNLKNVPQLTFFDQDLALTTPWFIDVMVENREGLIEYLKNNSVGSRVMYPPINQQPAYAEKGSFPVSERVGQKGLWLPSAAQLTDNKIDYITNLIETFFCKT